MNISITSEEVEHCRDSGSDCAAIEEAFRRAGFRVCRVIDGAVLVWDQEKRLRAFLLPDDVIHLPQREQPALPEEPLSFTVGMPIPVSCPDSRFLGRPKSAGVRLAVRATPRTPVEYAV